MNKIEPPCYVYLVRCSDLSLYCGMAIDLKKRLAQHNDGKGSKYCRSRLPVQLVWWLRAQSKTQAAQLERAIKKLSKKEKEEIVTGKMEKIERVLI